MTSSVDRYWYGDCVSCAVSSHSFKVWISVRLILRSEDVDSYSKSRPRGTGTGVNQIYGRSRILPPKEGTAFPLERSVLLMTLKEMMII
jgi:hypothetical protein